MVEARKTPPSLQAPTTKPKPVTYRISDFSRMVLMGGIWFCYGVNFLINIIGDWFFGIGTIVSFAFMIGVIIIFAIFFAFNGVYIFNWEFLKPLAWHFIISIIPIINILPLPNIGSKKQTVPLPAMVSMVRRIIEVTRETDEKKQKKIDTAQTAKQMSKLEVRGRVEAVKQSRLQKEEARLEAEMSSSQEEEML